MQTIHKQVLTAYMVCNGSTNYKQKSAARGKPTAVTEKIAEIQDKKTDWSKAHV